VSKITLGIIGVLLILMGIAALIPSWTFSNAPTWYAWVKIVIGVIALIVTMVDSK